MKLRKNILKILIFIFVLLININIKAEDNNIVTGTIYTLPSAIVNKLLSLKVYRGYGMDRQDIGIYMPQGSSFKIRIKQNKTISLELLNNDKDTEKSSENNKTDYEISNEWVTITAESDSVPFIRTLHSDSLDKVEYEITEQNGTQALTKFTRGNNESNFYNSWNGNSQKLAVITDDYITFLVPRENLDEIGAIVNHNSSLEYPYSSITDMLNWYDGVISRYNEYIGLSEDAKEEYNKDIRMKYFIKANIHGVGYAAYYPWNCIATNSNGISSFLHKGWTPVHEIGHGFQSYFTWSSRDINSEDLILSEVENNFFAYEEAKKYENNPNGGIGILYGDTVQQDYINTIQGISKFNELMGDGTASAANAGTRLFVFENLFDKIKMPTVMPYALRKYRSIKSNGDNIANSDLYGKYFSEASGYNVIPYLNYFKIYPSKEVEEEVYSNESPILYPIAQVFNDTTASSIATNLNLRGIYSVIDNNDVRNYISTNKINRDVKFKIATDNSKKLNHKKLYIKNSKNEIVRQEVLSGNEIVVKNLPVGMYYVEISSGSISNTNYILIPQTDSGKADLAPTGSSGNSQSNNVLTIDLNYNYNPNSDTEEQIVDVPNTGIVNSILIVIGMIFISAGIGLLIYKKEELR